jgi:hypothetical protein
VGNSSTFLPLGYVLLAAGSLSLVGGAVMLLLTHSERIEVLDSASTAGSSVRFEPPLGFSF